MSMPPFSLMSRPATNRLRLPGHRQRQCITSHIGRDRLGILRQVRVVLAEGDDRRRGVEPFRLVALLPQGAHFRPPRETLSRLLRLLSAHLRRDLLNGCHLPTSVLSASLAGSPWTVRRHDARLLALLARSQNPRGTHSGPGNARPAALSSRRQRRELARRPGTSV